MKLVSPCAEYQQSYRQYIKELGDEERYPFTLDFASENFQELLTKLDQFAKGINLPDGYVPSTTLWLVDQQTLIGVTNLRHFLNSQIEYCGGHIGIGIRPCYRGQKLGHFLMQQSIATLQQMGVNNVHIHCYKANLASAAIIVSNGGILDSEVALNDGTVQRYIVSKGQ